MSTKVNNLKFTYIYGPEMAELITKLLSSTPRALGSNTIVKFAVSPGEMVFAYFSAQNSASSN